MPAAVDASWHIASLCQMLVCGVHVLDGTETHDTGWVEEARVPVSDVFLFPKKHPPSLTTIYVAHVPSGFVS